MQQLQQALVRAAGRARPRDSELTVLLQHGVDDALTADGFEVERVEPQGVGWLDRLRWYNKGLPGLVETHRADVVYSLGGILSRALSTRCGTVTSINNMLAFTPRSIENYGRLSKERLRLFLLRRIYAHSVRLADAVVLHSAHARDLLSAHADGLEEKTLVVHTGIPPSLDFDPAAPPPHPYDGEPYLFYLSAIYAYKNHQTLIRAYDIAQRAGARLPQLLVAGYPSDPAAVQRIEEQIQRLGLEGQARYLGPLPRADISAWLHHATVNVFPSPCETNSVVLAETLGCHGVLACADAAPMPEVVGDAAAYFDPFDADALAALLTALWTDAGRRADLEKLAVERKKAFSWDACGAAIWEAAQSAAAAYSIRAGAMG